MTPRTRYVVCGNYESNSWSMEDLYSAVANSVSVKVFMALTAVQDFHCHQFDFKWAFLNADILEGHDYYVRQPPGLPAKPGMVWKLRKALYGLRRSPLYWFQTITPILEKIGMEPFASDVCLFRNKKTGTLLILYVDDLLISAKTVEEINRIRSDLESHYDLKSMGEAKRFLGFDIVRDRAKRTISLSQESYTRTIINKFGYEGLHAVKTPWPAKLELPKV